MERTLLYRAVCETTSDARLSVNTDLDGTLTLHGLSQSVKASLFIDGEIATEPVSLVVGPDGRVIEVRIVIHDGGIHLAADDYKTHITATLDY